MESRYNLTGDPFYYIMVAIFSLLATGLFAFGGMTRTMPILQALCLTAFAGLAIRQKRPGQAAAVATVWLVVQFFIIVLFAWLFVERAEQVVTRGFAARGEILDWLYADAIFPASFQSGPLQRMGEWIGVTLGSLITVGFIGFMLVVRAVNLAAFQAGVLLSTMETQFHLPAAVHTWTLLRIAGSTGLVILFAEPLLTRNWSPLFYITQRKRLILVSFGLLILGFLAELLLPSIWRGWFAPIG